MKRFSRFITLFLMISLVLATSAFAVDTKNEEDVIGSIADISGVSRFYEDFEGESFSRQKMLTQVSDPTTEPEMIITSGTVPTATSFDSAKFGHYRSVKSTDGTNTFGEWRFHDVDETVNASSDAYLALGRRSYEVSSLSYQILEFDMTTMTSFPSNLWIFSEWRDSNGAGKRRYEFGSYNDDDGLWHFGEKTVEIKKNEWAHITIVIKINATDDGTTTDYTSSVAHVFVNGKLVNVIYPYQDALISSSLDLKQHYLGIGWPYGAAGARPGIDPNSSVAVDNVSLTKCSADSYKGDLSKIFAADFTDLSTYAGDEIIYDDSYCFASSAMTTASVICGESTLNFDTAQAAADYIRDHSLEGATLRLYADHCYPLEIDTPLILDSNGYKLYNGVSTGKNAYLKSVDGELSFYESTSIFYANISIYQAPYEKRVTPVATLMLSIGESYVLPEAELYVDPETNERYEPLDEWLLYDASGKVISGGISQIAEEHIGEHYVLCPTYTSPSVYFTVIASDGSMTHYEDPTLLDGDHIPDGATVVLKRDIPYTKTISAKNYRVDLNGYTIYCVDGAKPVLFTGAGEIYIYSSRLGARVMLGSYMKNGNTDADGNPIYSNQAAFLVTDTDATQGTKYMLGYQDANTPSSHRIAAYGAAFIQLGKQKNVSVYLRNFDMICNAYDNKGILTTRYVVEGTRYWQIDNCDFIISNGKPLCSNVNTGVNVGTYVFNNSRVFGNGNLLGREGNVLSDFSVTLNSTSFYGTHKINPGSFSVDVTENEATVTKTFNTYVYFYGTGTVTSVSESGCILPDGHIIIPTVGIGTTSIFSAPAYARYASLLQDDIQYLGGNYTSAGYIGTLEEYTKQIHQSVAIDSSVNVVFFVPKNNALSGAYLNGENILDVNDYRMINGQNCYVLRVGVAPKDAYTDQQLVLSFGSSSETVTLDASLMHYAKKLFALTEEGANAAYFADSKSLMRYVLYYVRTAAKSLGDATDADLAAIDAYLEGFTLTASDKTISESIYETTAAAGSVDAATLDLQSKVGMVFRVAEGFVGTITASMPGVKDEVRTYTEDTPAPKDEYIILENIPAHKLCADVTLTITPSGADTIVLSYNLATYVNGVKTDISYAVYAYAKAAQTYREKYPTASVYAE